MNARNIAMTALALLACLYPCVPAVAQRVVASTCIGQPGDSAVGVAIQPDGAIVVAANVSGGPFHAGDPGPSGVVACLTPDGTKIASKIGVGRSVHDLAIDAHGNIYVAADEAVITLDRKGEKRLWSKALGPVCSRVDAGADGHVAALCHARMEKDGGAGESRIHVLDQDGTPLGDFEGRQFTTDVAVDSASKTVFYVGFRNATAWEGKRVLPVQIAYVIARSYAGEEKYRLYDWPTDRRDPGFLNRETNNMADTRGYRCAVGGDGLLYCAFECAGGNHIFRWEPRLRAGQWVSAKDKKPKGDEYHAFYNSRAEHKTFMACFDAATGELLRGQEFCSRLSSGRANSVRVKRGAITGTGDGSVLLAGSAAASLPATLMPPGTGEYGGGSFLLMMKADLTGRLFCARILPSSDAHAVAARSADGKLVIAVCGSISEKATDPLYTEKAIQPKTAADCGFLTVFEVAKGSRP